MSSGDVEGIRDAGTKRRTKRCRHERARDCSNWAVGDGSAEEVRGNETECGDVLRAAEDDASTQRARQEEVSRGKGVEEGEGGGGSVCRRSDTRSMSRVETERRFCPGKGETQRTRWTGAGGVGQDREMVVRGAGEREL